MKRAQGTIELRRLADGSSSYRLRYRVHGRRIYETISGCTDARQAEYVLSQRLQEIASGTWVHPSERFVSPEESDTPAPAGPVSFKELVEAFLDDYRPRSGRPTYYAERSGAWLRHLAGQPANLDAGEVRRFARARREVDGVSTSTIRKDLIALGTLYRWAIENDIVESSPVSRGLLRQFPEAASRAQYLTDEQEALLLAACNPALGRWVRWALETGMDRAEVCALDWSQIDEKAGVIHAPRAKSGEPRLIRLNGELRAILAECRHVRSTVDSSKVLLTERGRPWSPSGLASVLLRAYRRAGLGDVSQPAKVLRHTFATRLLMEGTNIKVVASMLGHSTIRMTETYGHLVPDAAQEAMDSLDRRRERQLRGSADSSGPMTGPQGSPGPTSPPGDPSQIVD